MMEPNVFIKIGSKGRLEKAIIKLTKLIRELSS
jgi:hypothetical protein